MKIARNNHGHFYNVISQLFLLYACEILNLVKWQWFCSIGAMNFESQIYKILQYRMLKLFWNIHSCVYRDICNDGHGGTMHTYAHIRSKHYPWFWNTNIFALNYKYICSQLQICLLQTENQLAKLATVAQCTHTLKYLICYGLRHLRKSTKSGLMFYPLNTVTISFQYVALHTGSDPMQTLNLQLWSNTNTMPWIRRARHLALNMWRSMPDLIQCKLYSWLRALIKCHP